MNVRLLLFAILALCVSAVAQTQSTTDSKPAEKAAEAWLQLLDASEYAKAYEQMDPLAKAMVEEAKFVEQLAAVRGAMGKLKSRKLKSAAFHSTLPGLPDGHYFLLQYDTSFEKKSEASRQR